MTLEPDPIADARPIDIDPARLRAWQEQARRLTSVSYGPLAVVLDLWTDPCRHRIKRAIVAARYVVSIADEPKKTEAVALAEDLARALDEPPQVI